MSFNYIEFKTGEKFATSGADTSPSSETFTDCGLIIQPDWIVIDIDNLPKETINAMIETFGIETQTVWTKRGVHLYFKKPRNMKVKKDSLNALGVEFEYKDSKNTPNGITIKQDGKLRQIDNFGTFQDLPDFLRPMNNVESLLGLGDGDRTDSRLYSHKFKIMKVSNWKHVMRFINQNIIAYPFNDKDLERIMRDEELRQGGDMNEYDVAMTLKATLKIVMYDEVLYGFNGEHYVTGSHLERLVADQLRGKPTRYQDEVIKQLKRYVDVVEEPKTGFDIKFKNGLLKNGEFWEITDSTDFTPYYITWNYHENAEPNETVDELLNHLSKGDDGQEPCPKYRDYILETVAHSLITNLNKKKSREFQKVFFYYGQGGNGKGAIISLIREMLCKGNYKTNKLEKFGDERYIFGMKGKLANIGDDIEDSTIKTTVMSNLKSMSGYEEIELRALFGMPVSAVISATQIFTSNHILKSFEKGDSWVRRVQWLPMKAKPEKTDLNFYDKLLTDDGIEYFLSLVMKAYFRLMETGKFTVSDKVEEFTKQYHVDNNTVLEFLSFTPVEDIVGCRTPEVYEKYQIWCEENGVHLQSEKQTKDTILTHYNLVIKGKKVQGKQAKVYQEK